MAATVGELAPWTEIKLGNGRVPRVRPIVTSGTVELQGALRQLACCDVQHSGRKILKASLRSLVSVGTDIWFNIVSSERVVLSLA